MADALYETAHTGLAKLIMRDVTGRVLVEATQIVRDRPEYPFTIEPGFREWIGPNSLGSPVFGETRGGPGT